MSTMNAVRNIVLAGGHGGCGRTGRRRPGPDTKSRIPDPNSQWWFGVPRRKPIRRSAAWHR
jgi:hypothetical protein